MEGQSVSCYLAMLSASKEKEEREIFMNSCHRN